MFKVCTIYCHLGHVTLTIYINFLSPFPRRLNMNFGVMLEDNGHIHVYSPGEEAENPQVGQKPVCTDTEDGFLDLGRREIVPTV